MQRQMQACGYKVWFSQAAKPTVAGAPPRGGAMIAARAYLDVRHLEVTTGLGRPVDNELNTHIAAVRIHAHGIRYNMYALY